MTKKQIDGLNKVGKNLIHHTIAVFGSLNSAGMATETVAAFNKIERGCLILQYDDSQINFQEFYKNVVIIRQYIDSTINDKLIRAKANYDEQGYLGIKIGLHKYIDRIEAIISKFQQFA